MIPFRSLVLRVLFVLLLFFEANAQQDAQYTQYMYNTISVNPAYAGSRGEFSAAALYRDQWIGLDGAPRTFTLNLHSPIRNSRVGYGLSVINDNIGNGVVQETSIEGIISYTIDVSLVGKLSFGIDVSANLLSLDYNGLRNFDVEPTSTENIENRFSPNFGLGIYYHANRFYAGLSVPNMFESDHFDNAQRDANSVEFISKERINFYIISGYVFDLSSSVKFKPAILSKIVSGAPLQLDMSANFLFNDRFTFGAAYRWDAAFSVMAGFYLSDQFMLGLAYDREITALGNEQFNDGSFELFARFDLVKTYKNLVSPRFF